VASVGGTPPRVLSVRLALLRAGVPPAVRSAAWRAAVGGLWQPARRLR